MGKIKNSQRALLCFLGHSIVTIFVLVSKLKQKLNQQFLVSTVHHTKEHNGLQFC